MLTYHVDAKVSGMSIQLIESQFSIVVIYGMEQTVFKTNQFHNALVKVKDCLNHALAHRLDDN